MARSKKPVWFTITGSTSLDQTISIPDGYKYASLMIIGPAGGGGGGGGGGGVGYTASYVRGGYGGGGGSGSVGCIDSFLNLPITSIDKIFGFKITKGNGGIGGAAGTASAGGSDPSGGSGGAGRNGDPFEICINSISNKFYSGAGYAGAGGGGGDNGSGGSGTGNSGSGGYGPSSARFKVFASTILVESNYKELGSYKPGNSGSNWMGIAGPGTTQAFNIDFLGIKQSISVSSGSGGVGGSYGSTDYGSAKGYNGDKGKDGESGKIFIAFHNKKITI